MRKPPAQNLIENLNLLLAETGMSITELAEKSGVSRRMINYILTGERGASVDVAEMLAKPFGINGWHLIMPNLKADLARSGRLDDIVERLGNSSNATKLYIEEVLKREATK